MNGLCRLPLAYQPTSKPKLMLLGHCSANEDTKPQSVKSVVPKSMATSLAPNRSGLLGGSY